MNKQPIEQSIREFIAVNLLYSTEEFTLPAEASLLNEGILDSLGVVELVEFVQNHFGIKVAQKEVTPDNFGSVGKLVGFVCGKLDMDKGEIPRDLPS
ncbi:MAG: acyl carrier protein [Verrucomicrobiota bacterium]